MGDAGALLNLRLLAEILFVVHCYLVLCLDFLSDLLIFGFKLVELLFNAAHPFLTYTQVIFSLLAECLQGFLPFVKPVYRAGKLLDAPCSVTHPSLDGSFLSDCRLRILCKKWSVHQHINGFLTSF